MSTLQKLLYFAICTLQKQHLITRQSSEFYNKLLKYHNIYLAISLHLCEVIKP
ncbi:MAG: hypothetical protein RL711_1153, partial [Bacteroidota bacterium]